MLINIIVLIVFWGIGMIIFTLGILQIILLLTCAIPLTIKTATQCKCFVDTGGIYRRITFTILLWSIISGLVIWAVFRYGSSFAIIGFLIGLGITFLFSLGRWGVNADNYSDYFQTYRNYYAKKDLKEMGIL